MRGGDVVWNTLTGEKALLVESAEESGGARIVVDLAVEEGGFVPGGAHAHDHCAEHFEVLEGRITFVIDGQERTLGPEEQVSIPRGAMHRWWNSGEGQVLARVRPRASASLPGGHPRPVGIVRRRPYQREGDALAAAGCAVRHALPG